MKLSKRSIEKLAGVNPRLIAIVIRAAEVTSKNFCVVEGRRTLARQIWLRARGKSKTLKSKHLTGLAVDIWPDPVNWNPLDESWSLVARAMYRAAGELDESIFRGADRWGWDCPHWELIP